MVYKISNEGVCEVSNLVLKVKKFRDNCIIPTQANKNDAGWDCYISEFFVIREKEKKLVPWREVMNKDANGDEVALSPHQRVCCGLGFSTEIPQGWYAQIVPRSGLAIWQGLTITNSPGTIDEGYRNEWTAIVVNTSGEERKLKIGDKICQFMLKRSPEITIEVVENLTDSSRGMGGFGSSDKLTNEQQQVLKSQIVSYIQTQLSKKLKVSATDIAQELKLNAEKLTILDEMVKDKILIIDKNGIYKLK